MNEKGKISELGNEREKNVLMIFRFHNLSHFCCVCVNSKIKKPLNFPFSTTTHLDFSLFELILFDIIFI